MCRLHYSCMTPCARSSVLTEELFYLSWAGDDSKVLWYIAGGCVIIRGIRWLSFGAAILPSGGRGASIGVSGPTAALFQVHFPKRKRVTGQGQNRLCCSCLLTAQCPTERKYVSGRARPFLN